MWIEIAQGSLANTDSFETASIVVKHNKTYALVLHGGMVSVTVMEGTQDQAQRAMANLKLRLAAIRIVY